MNEPTSETLAELIKRIEALEKKVSERESPGRFDWLKVVGISEDNEFTRLVLAEIEANRAAERKAAQEEGHE